MHQPILIVFFYFSESGPDPAEILTVVNVAENKYAFKTGYGRYMSVNTAGELTGRAEAIGPRETWEPVFEDVCVCVCVCVCVGEGGRGREGERESPSSSLTCRVKWLSVPATIGL